MNEVKTDLLRSMMEYAKDESFESAIKKVQGWQLALQEMLEGMSSQSNWRDPVAKVYSLANGVLMGLLFCQMENSTSDDPIEQIRVHWKFEPEKARILCEGPVCFAIPIENGHDTDGTRWCRPIGHGRKFYHWEEVVVLWEQSMLKGGRKK